MFVARLRRVVPAPLLSGPSEAANRISSSHIPRAAPHSWWMTLPPSAAGVGTSTDAPEVPSKSASAKKSTRSGSGARSYRQASMAVPPEVMVRSVGLPCRM